MQNQRQKKYLIWLSLLLIFKLVLLGVVFIIPRVAYLSSISSQELLELTNQERQKMNLPPIFLNLKLSKAALNKAQDMMRQGYFSHTTPQGEPFFVFIKGVNYAYKEAGENLAIDFITSQGVIRAWMKSRTHRDNILNPSYQEIGLSVLRDEFRGKETTLVVQLFGTRDKKETSLSSTNSFPHITQASKIEPFPLLGVYQKDEQILPLNSTPFTPFRDNSLTGFTSQVGEKNLELSQENELLSQNLEYTLGFLKSLVDVLALSLIVTASGFYLGKYREVGLQQLTRIKDGFVGLYNKLKIKNAKCSPRTNPSDIQCLRHGQKAKPPYGFAHAKTSVLIRIGAGQETTM